MAASRRRLRHAVDWDDAHTHCMLSLHDVFEVVGSQLTDTDVEVLSFLLNKTHSSFHPLDPEGWTVEPSEGNPVVSGVSPSPQLLQFWRRLRSQEGKRPLMDHKPKNGVELLLELERKGYISEGNLAPLLQLLRVLTRHDLLHLVSQKKRKTVSPRRNGRNHGMKSRKFLGLSGKPKEEWSFSQTQQPDSGINSPIAGSTSNRRRKKRGNGWSRRPKAAGRQKQELLSPLPEVSCSVRLRIRAEYLEHDSALRGAVVSNKHHPLEKQFDLFSQASSLLRTRDLGSIFYEIKFTELEHLEDFWGDYMSGALQKALEEVFITDAMWRAAGRERLHLLISVDQDDYDEAHRRLGTTMKPSNNAAGLPKYSLGL